MLGVGIYVADRTFKIQWFNTFTLVSTIKHAAIYQKKSYYRFNIYDRVPSPPTPSSSSPHPCPTLSPRRPAVYVSKIMKQSVGHLSPIAAIRMKTYKVREPTWSSFWLETLHRSVPIWFHSQDRSLRKNMYSDFPLPIVTSLKGGGTVSLLRVWSTLQSCWHLYSRSRFPGRFSLVTELFRGQKFRAA